MLSLVGDGVADGDDIEDEVLKGVSEFSSLKQIFSDESIDENVRFIEALIQGDWRNENIGNTWQSVDSWSAYLLVAFLDQSEEYLFECSEDSPEDILVLFDALSSLIQQAPNLLPDTLEETIRRVVENKIEPSWYTEKGESYRNFIGQVGLLKERYSAHLPVISQLILAEEQEENEVEDEFE